MQTKPLIIADRDIPFLEGVLEPYAEVRYLKGSAITANDVRGAEVLITRTRTRCDRALLEGSRIRLIATATIGFDHIDTDYCRSRGIRVTTAAGCNARGVLQYIMAVLCRLGAEPGWQPSERTLGIVGVGHVGSLVEEYGRLLGFRVVCCDPPRMRLTPGLGFLTLDELLSLSDIVTLHVPFTTEGPDKTAGMASGEFFARMRPGSAFINCSRGPVMQDGPLLDALRKGHIAYAAIDTWNHEPGIDRELLARAFCATPHIAGYSVQGKAAGTAAVVRSVSELYGLPLTEWYPPQVTSTVPDRSVTWDGLQRSLPRYFDIEAETTYLKQHPERFEELRNNYPYRTEYF